jgi:type VI secretion system secreted protein VgrG
LIFAFKQKAILISSANCNHFVALKIMSTTQEGRLLHLTTPLSDDFLLIKRFRANEGLNKLFQFNLEILHEENESSDEPTVVDVSQLLGSPMTVRIHQNAETERYYNGICVQFNQGNRNNRFTKYQAVLVPSIWLLTQNFQSRIFQNISVPDILKKVFEDYGVDYEIQGTFEPRNYCVQYRESDFDFASRLMEEEGIFYYFEHTNGEHRLIIANTSQSHRECPSITELPFRLVVGDADDWIPSVLSWNVAHQLRTGKVTLWDYNFQLPTSNLNAEQLSRFNIGGNQDLEFYDYQGDYGKRFDGIDRSGGEQNAQLQKVFQDRQRVAQIRQQEIDAVYKTSKGTSDCCALTAGYRFKLINHPTVSNNDYQVLVSVQTEAVQSPSYVSGEAVSNSNVVSFSCIPHGSGQAPFRPLRKTPKPDMRGTQTATVVGPAGEEIFTDKFGRVKVQFHWDRQGESDANSSCWIRVSQSWAGNKWGMMFIPRIGMEVVVNFIEGDPDQPIIVGCVYNLGSMPPYTLPDEKTKMTIKSDTTTGGNGFNELRFEDKKDSEQIFIHGEKDLDVRIKNDSRKYVGNDEHLIVKRDKRKLVTRDEHQITKRDLVESIERDHHKKVGGKEAVSIGGSLSLKVSGDVIEEFSSDHSEKTTGNIYLKGMNVVLEGMTGLTIKVGGSFVTINPAGVQISGPMVMINSGGSALSGSAGTIVGPMDAAIADKADDAKPGSKASLEKRSKSRSDKTLNEKNPDKKSWIKLKMVDEEGKPIAGLGYRVTAADGRVASGTLNEKGEAEVKGLDPGSSKISFPSLDQEAWEEG